MNDKSAIPISISIFVTCSVFGIVYLLALAQLSLMLAVRNLFTLAVRSLSVPLFFSLFP